jgi:hypothetical protein
MAPTRSGLSGLAIAREREAVNDLAAWNSLFLLERIAREIQGARAYRIVGEVG